MNTKSSIIIIYSLLVMIIAAIPYKPVLKRIEDYEKAVRTEVSKEKPLYPHPEYQTYINTMEYLYNSSFDTDLYSEQTIIPKMIH